MEKFSLILLLLLFQNNYAQVGIGTTNPQQKLHIASPTGTLRIESLNSTNNPNNGGDINGDGDFSNDLFPLYVDEYGDFTIKFKPLLNSEDIDALNNLPTSTVYLDPANNNGYEQTDIITYTITVTREALLEIKYNISFDVYYDSTKTIITDNLARKIVTEVKVSKNGGLFTKTQGKSAKCYSSGSLNSVAGTMYNSNTTYVTLPSGGTYDITFVGTISSNTKANGSLGTTSLSTYAEFGTGHDFVFFRLY